jgi:hypothetical protein
MILWGGNKPSLDGYMSSLRQLKPTEFFNGKHYLCSIQSTNKLKQTSLFVDVSRPLTWFQFTHDIGQHTWRSQSFFGKLTMQHEITA